MYWGVYQAYLISPPCARVNSNYLSSPAHWHQVILLCQYARTSSERQPFFYFLKLQEKRIPAVMQLSPKSRPCTPSPSTSSPLPKPPPPPLLPITSHVSNSPRETMLDNEKTGIILLFDSRKQKTDFSLLFEVQ